VVALPLAPLRRQRILSLVIAAIAGVSLVVGSLLGSNAYVAVVGLFALCLGADRTRTGDPEIPPSVVDRV
jgi:hypothetical protein